jgi:tetratricopeptide (TPR) repeat protein
MVKCMRLRSFAIVVIALGTASYLPGEDAVLQTLARGAALNAEGKFRAALTLVQPLLDSSSEKGDRAIAGVAWDVRGLALQNLGRPDEARRSYESAISILRSMPDQKIQYANALDNLGSLEAENGQISESKALRLKAREFYSSAGDYAGAARTASNLTILALASGSRKEARGYLADAYKEQARVATPDPRNVVWMLGAECLLDEADGKYRAGLERIDQLIDLWNRTYGPDYYLLASAYSIRGRLYHLLGDDAQAAVDLQHSLRLFSTHDEANSKLYFLVKIMYAKVLKHSGNKDDGARMESDARAALAGLRHQQCSGCTISAQGMR